MESLDTGYWNDLTKLNLSQWQDVSGLFTLKMTQISLEGMPLSQGCYPLAGAVPLSLFVSGADLCYLWTHCAFSFPFASQLCLSLASSTLIQLVLSLSFCLFVCFFHVNVPSSYCIFTQEKKTINLLWYLRSMYTLCWRNFQKCLFLSPFSSL